jgi:hypothetical protein
LDGRNPRGRRGDGTHWWERASEPCRELARQQADLAPHPRAGCVVALALDVRDVGGGTAGQFRAEGGQRRVEGRLVWEGQVAAARYDAPEVGGREKGSHGRRQGAA